MNSNDPYLAYYRNQQLGHGIASVYRGAPYQRGYGIGSFLGGLFRTVAPILKSGASTVGEQLLKSGVGFLGDIASGTMHPKSAADARLKEFTGALKRKADDKLEKILHGGGGGSKKRRVDRVTPQSLANLLRGRTSTKKKKKKSVKGKKKSAKGKKKTTKKVKTVKRSKTKLQDIFM